MTPSRLRLRSLVSRLGLGVALAIIIILPAGYFAIGSIGTATSLRKLLMETALVGLVSGLIAFPAFLIVRRIIDRMLAELETMQVRYRRLFDASPFFTVVVDRETLRLLDANEAAVRHYGWSRRELLAMTANDFYPTGDQPSGVVARLGPLRHRKKDGTIIDVEQTMHPIEYRGRPALLVTANDVTARNRVLKELRMSEQKYQALIEALPVGILESTTDGRIVTANAAWRRMFGFANNDDLGQVDVQTLYADPGDRRAVIETLRAEGTPPAAEAVFRRRDGTLFSVERYLRTVRNADGEIVGLRGIVIDIGHRKSLEAQLRAVAEDGSGRPAHRRHRPRLQQHPDGHHRQRRCARGATRAVDGAASGATSRQDRGRRPSAPI